MLETGRDGNMARNTSHFCLLDLVVCCIRDTAVVLAGGNAEEARMSGGKDRELGIRITQMEKEKVTAIRNHRSVLQKSSLRLQRCEDCKPVCRRCQNLDWLYNLYVVTCIIECPVQIII